MFYARFYIQWIVSEIRGKSVVPVAFWYLSGSGSLMLLLYAVSLPSPVGAISHCFNSVVYARNLHHVWRADERASSARSIVLHVLVALILVFGITMVVVTWQREMDVSPGGTAGLQERVLFWIVVGAVGQGLFALRFIIQWLATERAGHSHIPPAFWYISLAASILLLASHGSRGEWIFVAGLASTVFVYVRNIVLVHREGRKGPRDASQDRAD